MNGYPFLSWVRKDPVKWRARGWTLTPDRRAVKKCRPRQPLMIMPANNSSAFVHYLAGKYPNRIGWLVGPKAMSKTRFRKWIPFALDNDAFSSWTNGEKWDEEAWLAMIRKIRSMMIEPFWALVPDVVANKEATLDKWKRYYPVVKNSGIKAAFAVQDGMTLDDVPQEASCVFVGGTTEWKWRNVRMFADGPLPVHVGRVNSIEKVMYCDKIGVVSIDGTGWMRDSDEGLRCRNLEDWLGGEIKPHPELFLHE